MAIKTRNYIFISILLVGTGLLWIRNSMLANGTSNKSNENKQHLRAHNFMELSKIYSSTDLDSSLMYGCKALTYFNDIKDNKNACLAYIEIGTTLLNETDSVYKALLYFSKAENIAVNNGYNELHGHILDLKCRVYTDFFDNFIKAIQLGLEARDLLQSSNNQTYKYLNFIHIANAYFGNKHYELSLNYYKQALGFSPLISKEEQATVYIKMAEAYFQLEQFDRVQKSVEHAIELATLTDDKNRLAKCDIVMAELYLMNMDYKSAIELAIKGINRIKNFDEDNEYQLRGNLCLKKSFAMRHQYDSALKYAEIAYAIKNQIHEKSRYKEINVYLLKEKENENAILQKEQKLQSTFIRNQTIGISFTTLVVFISLILAFRLRKAKEKLKKSHEGLELEVKQRTEQYENLNSELLTFLYNSSHSLRSPISTLTGLVNLIELSTSLEYTNKVVAKIPYNLEKFSHALDKLQLMHEVLSSKTEMNFITEPEKFINAILDEFYDQLKIKNIQTQLINSVNGEIRINEDLTKIALKIIIENAIHFTNPDNHQKRKIVIDISDSIGWLVFSISDNGVGIDPHDQRLFQMFHRGHESSKGPGLGLYVVQKAVNAMKGKVIVNTNPLLNTQFDVYLPIKK